MTTLDAVCRLVATQLGLPGVDGDARLVEDLGAESMDLVGLLGAVEDRFGVAIDETELRSIRTVRELAARVGPAGVGRSAGDPAER